MYLYQRVAAYFSTFVENMLQIVGDAVSQFDPLLPPAKRRVRIAHRQLGIANPREKA
jgi:hypothetical protein